MNKVLFVTITFHAWSGKTSRTSGDVSEVRYLVPKEDIKVFAALRQRISRILQQYGFPFAGGGFIPEDRRGDVERRLGFERTAFQHQVDLFLRKHESLAAELADSFYYSWHLFKLTPLNKEDDEEFLNAMAAEELAKAVTRACSNGRPGHITGRNLKPVMVSLQKFATFTHNQTMQTLCKLLAPMLSRWEPNKTSIYEPLFEMLSSPDGVSTVAGFAQQGYDAIGIAKALSGVVDVTGLMQVDMTDATLGGDMGEMQ